jgi:hypothetical protein
MKGSGVQKVIIERRFRGPPESANGGYAAGLLARLVPGAAEVTLHRPPPLGAEIVLRSRPDGGVELLDGAALVAVAVPAELKIEMPAPVSVPDARAATASFPGIANHPFPGCFVCGPERDPADGLCIQPGPVPGRDVAAAVWTPHASLANDGAHVATEYVWAALDCPSWFGTMVRGDRPPGVYVLGRLTGEVMRYPRVDRPCVCVGWEIAREGRKLHTGSAIFAEDGTPLAASRAVWIRLKEGL